MTQNYTKQFENFIQQLTNDICKAVLRDSLLKYQHELSNSTDILNKCVSTAQTSLGKTLTGFDKAIDVSSASFKNSTDTNIIKLEHSFLKLISDFKKTTTSFANDFDQMTQNLKSASESITNAGSNIAKTTESLPSLTKAIESNSSYCSKSLEKLAEQESDLGKIIKANYDEALRLYADNIEGHFQLALVSYSEELKTVTNAQLTTFEILLKKSCDNTNSDIKTAFEKFEKQCAKHIEQLNNSNENHITRLTETACDLLQETASEFSSTSMNHAINVEQLLSSFISEINPEKKFDDFTNDMDDLKKKVESFTDKNREYMYESRKSLESFVSQAKETFQEFYSTIKFELLLSNMTRTNKLAIVFVIFQILNFAGLIGLAYIILAHIGI